MGCSLALSIILIGGQVVQSLMGPNVIIGIGPLLQLMVVPLQVQVDVVDFIKLLPMRPVRPFHSSIQFGRTTGKLEKADVLAPAGLLKLVLEL